VAEPARLGRGNPPHPNPLALLPVLVLLIAVTAVTLYLAGARDTGAAALPGRDASPPHLALLGGPARPAVGR
jgi:hypothetical protein